VCASLGGEPERYRGRVQSAAAAARDRADRGPERDFPAIRNQLCVESVEGRERAARSGTSLGRVLREHGPALRPGDSLDWTGRSSSPVVSAASGEALRSPDRSSRRSGKLEQIGAGYATRERFLTELTLDPPEATGADAGTPLLEEDYLILSTIHSAKGQEWDAVFILNVADGCIPSDMAAGSAEQIEEERRVLGVAMTRAKFHLHLIQPLRFFRSRQHRYGDSYVFAPRSRFIPDNILDRFECRTWPVDFVEDAKACGASAHADVAARMREIWR
jgi:UvrD-like helicase C-terminal domain